MPRHLPRIPYGTPKLPPASGARTGHAFGGICRDPHGRSRDRVRPGPTRTGLQAGALGAGPDVAARGGWPCLAGIRPGVDVLKVDAPSARGSLWTAEQGLDCPSFSAVIVEIWGDPPAVDFTRANAWRCARRPTVSPAGSCAGSRNPISAPRASAGGSVRFPRTGMLSTFAHRACRAGGWNCSGRVCGRLAPGPPAMTRPINSWCWTATGPLTKQAPRRTSPARSERSRGPAPRRFFRCPA